MRISHYKFHYYLYVKQYKVLNKTVRQVYEN